jgi:predicted component of type VI protein secretion system
MPSQLYLESLLPVPGESAKSRSFEITKFPSVVGRSPECDCRISNPLISRRHCSFFRRNDEIWVRDLDSQNGTRLNGEGVTREKSIHEGDELEIGYLPYRVHESNRSRDRRFWPHQECRKPGMLGSFVRQLVGGFQKPTPA